MADAGRRLHLLFALDEVGLDVALFDANRDADFIEADAGVAGGMLGEERNELVAARDAFRDGAPPVVAELDLALVEPDGVPALFQVGLDATHELFVAVVPVAQKDSQRARHGTIDVDRLNGRMFRTDEEFADLLDGRSTFRANGNLHGVIFDEARLLVGESS